jgi:replication factor C subunit 1
VCFQGAANCLEGSVFVLTGVLESMERDDTKSLIERYGGKVTGNVSKKTSYLVAGRDSGVSKTEKVTAGPLHVAVVWGEPTWHSE